MAVEQLFAHFRDQKSQPNAIYDPSDPESYEAYLFSLMDDSQDYEDSILAGSRSEAQLYYNGYEPAIEGGGPSDNLAGEDPNQTLGELLNRDKKTTVNRSTFVSTDVKDAVLLMLPSLIRLFGASESPVFLVPRAEADSDMAEQATSYVNYVFWNDNPGFLNLYGAIKDALTVRTGFIKWWSEDQKEFKNKRFTNITVEQLQMILSEDQTAKVVELGKPVKQHAPTISPYMAGTTSGPPAPPPMDVSGAPQGFPGGATPPGPPMGPMGGPPPGEAPSPGGPPPGPMAGAPPPSLPAAAPQPPPIVYDHAVIQYEVSKPLIKIAGVPPEEMRIDRYARSFATAGWSAMSASSRRIN